MSLHHVLDERFETVVKPRLNKLDRIEAVEHHITGDPRDRSRGAGWEYVHVYIDDASRLAYSEVLRDERKESAVPFLERALGWFAGYGVTVERVMTDNSSAYRSHPWRQACGTFRLRYIRTKPHTPRTNGKAERFIQTSLREWAYAQAYTSSQARQYALADLARPLRHRSAAHRSGQPTPGHPARPKPVPWFDQKGPFLRPDLARHARSRRDPCLMLSTTSLATTTRTVRRRHDSHETRL